jgi:predicted acetyltransferase
MIQQASIHTQQAVRDMWKVCFDDTDAFMLLYFSEKYDNENTLVYIENGKVVASLQLLPYRFTFCGVEIPVGYISGACTLPACRNKGFMSRLLLEAFGLMRQRNIPLSLLIPAEDWLYGYYANCGYETVFDADDTEIPLKRIVDKAYNDLSVAYADFDKNFRQRDFCIQKSMSDFITIVKDAELDGFPPKTNLSGMARVIDAPLLCRYFARRYPEKSLCFEVKDQLIPSNNGVYGIKTGDCRLISDSSMCTPSVDINILCRLLMGYRLDELIPEWAKHFEPHKPLLNLMLE